MERAKRNFPSATIVLINSSEEQRQVLISDREIVDAVLDQAEEGAAWTVLYPKYTLVVPDPITFIPVAYAIAPSNEQLLKAVNNWLNMSRPITRVDQLYRYWILGEGTKVREIPRWSVARDVLGWGRLT